jgi:hypothetical protein
MLDKGQRNVESQQGGIKVLKTGGPDRIILLKSMRRTLVSKLGESTLAAVTPRYPFSNFTEHSGIFAITTN